MKFEDFIKQPRRVQMNKTEDHIRFIDVENPHLKVLIQFPVTTYVRPVEGWCTFAFTQPSFHENLREFQEHVQHFLRNEYAIDYEPVPMLKMRYDAASCVCFHHTTVDENWVPDERYVTPVVALHGLKSLEDKLCLDLQVVQLKFYEKNAILPDLTIPLFDN